MPSLSKPYARAKFDWSVIELAKSELHTILSTWLENNPQVTFDGGFFTRNVTSPYSETWEFDTDEEFAAEHRKGDISSSYAVHFMLTGAFNSIYLTVDTSATGTSLAVSAPTRSDVLRVVGIFDTHVRESTPPPPPPSFAQPKPAPRIFIGHGQAHDWQTLAIELKKHEIDARAFETGARAGHTLRDILDGELLHTDLALIVLTAEDEQLDGRMHARQNVVHEAGLFQGRLGWGRAILLIEEGVEEFSNSAGVIHIKFRKNAISSVIGDVLAVLKREKLI